MKEFNRVWVSMVYSSYGWGVLRKVKLFNIVVQLLLILESPSQFENRIMPLVYIRSITRSAMNQKSSILLAVTGK